MYLYYIYISVVVALYLFTCRLWLKLQNTPPTPLLHFPVIGHLHLFKNPIIETYENLATRYGSIVMLWRGSKRVLIVSCPLLARDCLSRNDVIFCNRPQGSLVGSYIGSGYKSLSFAPYGPHWKNLRKLCASMVLAPHRLQQLSSIRVEEVRQLLRGLCQVSQKGLEGVELKSRLLDMALNIMKRMVFGDKYEGDRAKKISEIFAGQARLSDEVSIGDWIPFLRWFEWSRVARLRKFKEERDVLTMELLEEHRKELKQNHNDNGAGECQVKPFIRQLLELQESDPNYYTDEILLGLMWDLIGGSRSIAGAIELILSLLLNHPDVLQKLHSEIETHVGYDRFVEESDLSHLQYLDNVIKESLRMDPLFPVIAFHESSKDCTVGRYHVPAGTELHVNLCTSHKDPRFWKDPYIFRPERFEGVEGKKRGAKLMSFGYGRRSCPAEGLAVRVMALTVGSLIQCFEWRRTDDKLVDMAKMPGFVMHKTKQPMCAKLQIHPSMENLLARP